MGWWVVVSQKFPLKLRSRTRIFPNPLWVDIKIYQIHENSGSSCPRFWNKISKITLCSPFAHFGLTSHSTHPLLTLFSPFLTLCSPFLTLCSPFLTLSHPLLTFCWTGTDCSSTPYGIFVIPSFFWTLLIFFQKIRFTRFFCGSPFGWVLGEPLTLFKILKSG